MSVPGQQASFSKVVAWKENQCASTFDESMSSSGVACAGNTVASVVSACDVSSLGTSSALVSGSASESELAAPPDTVKHIELLLASGVSPTKVVEVVQGLFACYMGYLQCHSRVPLLPETPVTSVASESVSTPSKRALRRQRNKEYGRALAEEDGFCYLRPVRRDRRKLIHRTLGPSPTWLSFVKMLVVQDLDMPRANTCRVYKLDHPGVANAYHVAYADEDCVGEDVGSFMDVLMSVHRLLGLQIFPNAPVTRPLVVPVGVVSGKEKCDVCGFFVNPDGHGVRCKAQPDVDVVKHLETRQVWDCVEKLAKFGDLVHKWDVNVALRAQSVDWPDLEFRSQAYISAEAQARYICNEGDDGIRFSAGGTSSRKLSCAFEASYMLAPFRDKYLHLNFPVQYDIVQSSGAGSLDCTSVVGGIVHEVEGRLSLPVVDDQGFCYVKIVNATAKQDVITRLGANPTFGKLLGALRPSDVDMFCVNTVKVYRVADKQCHLSSDEIPGVQCLGTVGSVLGSLIWQFPDTVVQGFPVPKCKQAISVSIDDHVGLFGMVALALSVLTVQQLRTCVSVGLPVTLNTVVGGICDGTDQQRLRLCLSRKAWLGDVQHRLDVRAVLLSMNASYRGRGTDEELCVGNSAQAGWFMDYDGIKELPGGTSNHSIATAFEASYYGKFRQDYIDFLLVAHGMCVPNDIACFFCNHLNRE